MPAHPTPDPHPPTPSADPDSALPPELARARALVLRHGWNSTAYQLLNPGISRWFSGDGDALAGYAESSGVRVVAGAPVCRAERLADVAAEFERDARAAGMRVCYFCAEARLRALYRDSPAHRTVCMGAQPVWRPGEWPAIIDEHASLRAQLNRARNKSVCVREWHAREAGADPRLRTLLRQWLRTRGLPSLHFLVEPQTLSRLFDRRIFVAERAGEPVAFLVASPIPARNGWLVEQMVRGAGAPNGAIELLVDAAMRALASSGAAYVTLGLAPLSRHVPGPPIPQPLWLTATLRWVRAHGRRFYNFDGLDTFKAKLKPHAWEPVFAIAATPSFSPRMLHAIAGAFSGSAPEWLVARALARAAAQEAGWLANAVRRGRDG